MLVTKRPFRRHLYAQPPIATATTPRAPDPVKTGGVSVVTLIE